MAGQLQVISNLDKKILTGFYNKSIPQGIENKTVNWVNILTWLIGKLVVIFHKWYHLSKELQL